ncbi:hypothetical protein INT45_011064 [Circinella minor]|uniref:Uncharacterized protein n=1 Tax=Circinella minor TaxID=1195481 RepID=A0A8H7SFD4_9FUNG|nr:hypothetical protein INT45_011064 [Circinella minor]
MTRRLEQFKSVTTLDLSYATTLSSRAARTFIRDLYRLDRGWTLRLPLDSIIRSVALTTINTTTTSSPSPVTRNAPDENTSPSQTDMSIPYSSAGLTNRDTNKMLSLIPWLGHKRPNDITNTPLHPKDVNLDEWETPPIAREHQQIPTPQMKKLQDHYVHRLLNCGEYKKLDVSSPISDSRLPPNAPIKNMNDIQAAIIEYGSQLLESIIMFDSNWFFITSVDVFLHNNPSIDDCVDGDKLNQKHKAFLEYAIHDLTKSLQETKTSNIMFILENYPEFTQSNRHLRQYANASALLPWSLQSLRFVKRGMYPINSLAFDNHVVFESNKTVSVHMVANIIICSIAKGTMEKETYSVAVIDVLVKMEQDIRTGDSEEHLTGFIVREKDTVLDRVISGGYSGAITQQNKKICSNFEKNCPDTL